MIESGLSNIYFSHDPAQQLAEAARNVRFAAASGDPLLYLRARQEQAELKARLEQDTWLKRTGKSL